MAYETGGDMPIGYARWELRDSSNRVEVERAAADYCHALRNTRGVEDARFYWAPDETLVILIFASQVGAVKDGIETRLGRALFLLGDLALHTQNEIWLEPQEGEVAGEEDTCRHLSTVSVTAGGLERIVCESCGRVMIRHESTISGVVDRKKFARRPGKLK